MPYQVGKNKINKHFYHVFMRRNGSALGLSTAQLAAACGLDKNNMGLTEGTIALDDTSTIDEVDTTNTLYTLDSTGGAISLDLTTVTGATGDEDDVALFKVIGYTSAITLTVSGGTITLGAVGDLLSVKFDSDTAIVSLSVLSSADNNADFLKFQEIGYTDENPSIKVSVGEDKQLNVTTKLRISENVELDIADLQVSKTNFDGLRTFLKNYDVDVFFYDSDYPLDSFTAYDLILSGFFEGEGNTLNRVALSGSKEVADSDNNLEFITT